MVKPNGFSTFLFKYKNENKLSMSEAQSVAGDLWKNMSEEQRLPYKTKSKSISKIKVPNNFEVKADEDRIKKIQEQKKVELTIEEMLQTAFEKNEIKTTTFIFFSTSYFYVSLQGETFPAEIAMSKFSLKEGVYDTFHLLVNPGKLPVGAAGPSEDHAKKTHLLPLPPQTGGETDFKIMLKKILDFIGSDKSNKKLPLIFAESGYLGEDLKTAVNTLEKITDEAEELNISFRVYPIEQLFFRLYKKVMSIRQDKSNVIPVPSPLFALEILQRDKFTDYDIGCDFHQAENANKNCCLAMVKSFGYTVALYCCDKESEEFIPGRHQPASLAEQNANLSNAVEEFWEDDFSQDFKFMSIGSVQSIHCCDDELSCESSKVSLGSLPNESDFDATSFSFTLCDKVNDSNFETKDSFDQTVLSPNLEDEMKSMAVANRPRS